MLYTPKLETTTDNLLELISYKRDVMLKVAEEFGIDSEKTLECSQGLDALLVKYQQVKKLEGQS